MDMEECREERALKLKASFMSQVPVKNSSKVLYNHGEDDGVWCSSEDFPVEELLNLDFSDKEFQDVGFFEEEGLGSDKFGCSNNSAVSSGADDFDGLSTGNLAVEEVEGLESLEWLSQFVDDSTAELWPTGNFTANDVTVSDEFFNHPPQEIRTATTFFHTTTIPRKTRNKRRRSNGLPWSLVSPPVDSTSASSSSQSHDSELLSRAEPPPLPPKKTKRKAENENGVVSGRRCTHCQVQKTPQWRTGPLGPKTLCNACGVRFKTGRLFPEYRPACSPTFSEKVHSNSHRKVLEMRRMKEMTAAQHTLIRSASSGGRSGGEKTHYSAPVKFPPGGAWTRI